MAEQITSPPHTPLANKSEEQLKRETRARLRHLDPITATELFNEVLGKEVTGSVSGFVNFLRERAIVGLAVGFVIGTQVQTVVRDVIAGFVDPSFQLLVPGDQKLSKRVFTAHFQGHSVSFGWGAVVYDLLDFFFVVLIMYIFIKLFKLDQLDQPNK